MAPDSIGLRFVLQALPATFSLICNFCSSGQDFAASFLQIPPRDGHPCLRLTLPTVKARSGLSPYSYRPCRAHKKRGLPWSGYSPLLIMVLIALKTRYNVRGISISSQYCRHIMMNGYPAWVKVKSAPFNSGFPVPGFRGRKEAFCQPYSGFGQ